MEHASRIPLLTTASQARQRSEGGHPVDLASQARSTALLPVHRRHQLRRIPLPGDFQLAEGLICLLQIRLSRLHR
jgi:hypothetical protein